MKTLVCLFASLLFCFTTVPSFAQEKTEVAPAVYEKIVNNLHVPDNMKGNVSAERVLVVFTIDESGHAHVDEVASRRPDLCLPVKEQFEALDFSGTGYTSNQSYSIWLNFKVM